MTVKVTDQEIEQFNDKTRELIKSFSIEYKKIKKDIFGDRIIGAGNNRVQNTLKSMIYLDRDNLPEGCEIYDGEDRDEPDMGNTARLLEAMDVLSTAAHGLSEALGEGKVKFVVSLERVDGTEDGTDVDDEE